MLKNINKQLTNGGNMDKQKTKKVAVDVNIEQQKTLVNDIVIGSSEIGHKRITLTTLIINTLKEKKVELEYKDKSTGLIRKFNQMNTITNRDVRGFVESYKEYLGVNTLTEWNSQTDTGKERMRILKDSFWVALPLIKADCVQKNKKGEQFTGNRNSEIFIDGDFANEYSPNPQHKKGADQVSMKFSELKKASQNYYADKNTNLSTNESSGTDNSFVKSLKRMTLTINASKDELVLKKEQAGTENAIKSLAIACNQWTQEFNKVKESSMTPEQVARLKKTA